jgi:signal transduction histidine kinase
MVFWVSILAGGLFAWLAIKMGFYEIWVMLFNIVISIYVAVFLTPVVVDVVPAAGDTAYGNALTLTVTAIGTFLILYAISYIFLTGQFSVSFPKTFDILLAGFLGFLAGFLLSSFAALIITATPISQNTFVSEVGFNRQSQQANISYICWWCDLVDSIVSSPDKQTTSEQTINQLLNSGQSKAREETGEEAEPNKPVISKNMGKSTRSLLRKRACTARTGARRTRPAWARFAGLARCTAASNSEA